MERRLRCIRYYFIVRHYLLFLFIVFIYCFPFVAFLKFWPGDRIAINTNQLANGILMAFPERHSLRKKFMDFLKIQI